jgi:hypothetical protein
MTNSNFLREIEITGAEFSASPSPAVALDIPVGMTEDGLPNWQAFRVEQVVASASGKLWKVAGFTHANTIVCRQYGLSRDPAIKFAEFTADGLQNVSEQGGGLRHKDGLVTFA